MKFLIPFFCFLSFWSCTSVEKTIKKSHSFYVGTYTNADSKGIYKYTINEQGHFQKIGLVAASKNPSFLTISNDKKTLLAVNEELEGSVESFSIKKDSLVFINRSSSGGAHPCYVSINKDGYVLTANYTGGNVGLLKISPKGMLSKLLDVQQHYGSGTTERQEAPHAHSACFSPTENEVISVDLGTNQLWFSSLDTTKNELVLATDSTLSMKTGAGPRHLAFHPIHPWIYVVNELDCSVSLVNKNDKNSYSSSFSISTLPSDFTQPNTCADIKISNDGKFLYVSNRGHNSIAIFKIKDNGILEAIGYESTRGEVPRNFTLSPDNNFIIVANQSTNNLVSFQRDSLTGTLNYINQTEAPTPVCILFE